jgi:hypothetical protein
MLKLGYFDMLFNTHVAAEFGKLEKQIVDLLSRER